MGLNRLIGQEPIKVDSTTLKREIRVEQFFWNGNAKDWVNPSGGRIRLRSVYIRAVTDVTAPGRNFTFYWNTNRLRPITTQNVIMCTEAYSQAPTSIGHFCWATGLTDSEWGNATVDYYATHGLPEIIMEQGDWLAFTCYSGTVGDNFQTVIQYEAL